MKESTKLEYIKLADNFIKTRISNGQTPTAKTIADCLLQCASEYRPAYWRRLRRALVVQQQENGFDKAAERIGKLVNPVTAEGSTVKPKAKQDRIKRISDSDQEKLIAELIKTDGHNVALAIALIKYTGARPVELSGITVVGNELHIQGAKKSHGGKRGADRVMVFDTDTAEQLGALVAQLQGVNVGAMQDKLRNTCKRLWPQRKALPTFYSWRHQLGSELKASKMSRTEIAYLMGHQSTGSIDVYGDRRTAKGGVLPKVSNDADLSKIRVNHNEPPVSSKNVEKSFAEKPVSPFEKTNETQVKQRLLEKHDKNESVDRGPSMG